MNDKRKEYLKKWREDNKEHIRKYKKEYYRTHDSSFKKLQDKYKQLQQENKQLKMINKEYERLDNGKPRGFVITRVDEYDIYDLLRYKENWNKLKEWVNKNYDYYMNNEDYIGGRLCFTDMKNNMQELEQGSDSNENN